MRVMQFMHLVKVCLGGSGNGLDRGLGTREGKRSLSGEQILDVPFDVLARCWCVRECTPVANNSPLLRKCSTLVCVCGRVRQVCVVVEHGSEIMWEGGGVACRMREQSLLFFPT
jgi:hypothetical protein